jgi:hypothetical protein
VAPARFWTWARNDRLTNNQVVDRLAHGPLDGVLDGHDAVHRFAFFNSVENLGDGRAWQILGILPEKAQRRFVRVGEGGTEIADHER